MSDRGTEQASPQKKRKARESGDIVRSRELLSAVSLLLGLLTINIASASFVRLWASVYQIALGGFRSVDVSEQLLMSTLRIMFTATIRPLGAILGVCCCGAFLTGIVQGGGISFHAEALEWKFTKLNPITNLKNLLSLRASARVAKSVAPAVVMCVIGWYALRSLLETMPVMSTLRLSAMFATSYRLILDAAWVSVLWSGLDYAVEWHSWNDRLKMTKQELRDEAKEASGNPQIKGRVRQIQRLMRRRRTKADVSKASVVITNPTHYAVALLFSFETMQAPTVLAKGRDLHAAEIREEARWAGVPLMENPLLARSLYQSVEPGQSIPYELYQAVAAILAFLYRERVEDKIRRERLEHKSQKDGSAALSGLGRIEAFRGGM